MIEWQKDFHTARALTGDPAQTERFLPTSVLPGGARLPGCPRRPFVGGGRL